MYTTFTLKFEFLQPPAFTQPDVDAHMKITAHAYDQSICSDDVICVTLTSVAITESEARREQSVQGAQTRHNNGPKTRTGPYCCHSLHFFYASQCTRK